MITLLTCISLLAIHRTKIGANHLCCPSLLRWKHSEAKGCTLIQFLRQKHRVVKPLLSSQEGGQQQTSSSQTCDLSDEHSFTASTQAVKKPSSTAFSTFDLLLLFSLLRSRLEVFQISFRFQSSKQNKPSCWNRSSWSQKKSWLKLRRCGADWWITRQAWEEKKRQRISVHLWENIWIFLGLKSCNGYSRINRILTVTRTGQEKR